MDFDISKEQKAWVETAREVCEKYVDSDDIRRRADISSQVNTREELQDNMPWEVFEKLHDAGLRTLVMPKEYGGGGAGWLTGALVTEEIGYQAGILCRCTAQDHMYCGRLEFSGSEKQKEEIFAEMLRDKRWIGCVGIIEKDLDTDYSTDKEGFGFKCFARREGDEYVINGRKTDSRGGGLANWIMPLAVRTSKKGKPSENTTRLIVRTDTPGVSIEKFNHLIGEDLTGNVDWLFEDVRVPVENVFGGADKANQGLAGLQLYTSMKVMPFSGLIGWARKIYELTLEYAKSKTQGGRPIIEQGQIAAIVPEMAVRIETVRLLMLKAAYQCEVDFKAGRPQNRVWGLWLNYYYKDVASRLCQIVSEVFGYRVSDKELPIEAYIRYFYSMYYGGGTPLTTLIDCAPSLIKNPWPEVH